MIENLIANNEENNRLPQYNQLQEQFAETGKLVDDLVLKNYITRLSEMDVLPLDKGNQDITKIRLFRVTEMVYRSDEYATFKFASVFNAVQSLNCSVFLFADSNVEKTEFYMGIRAMDDRRTTKSLKDTLKNALRGQFPGVKTEDLLDCEAENILTCVKKHTVATVSCVANNKDEGFTDNRRFLQGLEKMAVAMQGQKYTAIVLAKGAPATQLAEIRGSYERIYTQISPFSNMQINYGTNRALSISDALSTGMTTGSSHASSESDTEGTSSSTSTTTTATVSKETSMSKISKLAAGAVGVAGVLMAPLTGGTSVMASSALAVGMVAAGLNLFQETKATGTSTGEAVTKNTSQTYGSSDTTNESVSETTTQTKGMTSSNSQNMQLTVQNKTLLNTLERIDLQLKRLNECESVGMWECAAYFLSDSQETAEMAAGTYKALMNGDNSGVETSAINIWGREDKDKVRLINDYVTNFLHPVFAYSINDYALPVTAASLVSGNELAIHMGLPRRSVCGFPVIEHADFGKEVVKLNRRYTAAELVLGRICSMGSDRDTEVKLDRNSLTMHTFITGSTGSGKSNTVYEMLRQLRIVNIPFLVIEPAKGEYKNIFGQYRDVVVYGTNPKKSRMLKINPFRFPEDVHVLEHLDRLVELFNVCWPMYAAMPAILKEACERAYVAAGWNLRTGANAYSAVYPEFTDVLEQIEAVIAESKYSSDSKGDYTGALCTRVRSLINGINGMIFCSDDIPDKVLFDSNVIVDLSRVGSVETKSLIMGLLVMKLHEYRVSQYSVYNNTLRHVTVLEEAHNLLKRTSAEQTSETSNLAGKSVELLANAISEMRTYGEGFIIADQSPGLLDMSVIRNTNTKIILRLPEQSDRELAGRAAGLNDSQVMELTKLERGVAAVYQNDWVEPVLVKINHCDITGKLYSWQEETESADGKALAKAVVFMLIKGRVHEQLDVRTEIVEQAISRLVISTANRLFLSGLLAEFKARNNLELWKDEHLVQLGKVVTDVLGCRATVEREVAAASNNKVLTEQLTRIIHSVVGYLDDSLTITVAQCLLRDFSAGRDERETRARIYYAWVEDTRGDRGF